MNSKKDNLEFSAGGVVYKKVGEDFCFALILSKDNTWTFPKGHIEDKEIPEEAALREVEEEIGISDLKIEVLLEKIDYWFVFQDKKIHKFVYYYLMKTSKSTLTPQLDEISDAKWVKADEIINMITYKEDLSVMTKALSLLNI